MECESVREYLRNCLPECRIYIGCDSDQNIDKDYTVFHRVIVIHKFVGDIQKGCKVFGETLIERKHHRTDLFGRLWREVELSVELAEKVRDIAENKFDVFEIHLDLNKNPNHKSHSIVGSAIGYIKGLGLTPRVKPDAPAATAAAHSFARIQ